MNELFEKKEKKKNAGRRETEENQERNRTGDRKMKNEERELEEKCNE